MPLSDYHYAIEKRRRQNVPAHVKAQPTARDLTLSHLTQKGLAQERVRAANERARVDAFAYGTEARLREDALDDAKKDIGIAAGISLANLGLTGYGTYKAVQHQNRLLGEQRNQSAMLERLYKLRLDEIEDRAAFWRNKRNFIRFGDTAL